MPLIDIKPKVKKFIISLPIKHQQQIKSSILSLKKNPLPQDSKKLQGYENYTRIDIGEYRIIYRYDKEEDLLTVVLAGKRNDNYVYKVAKRNLK
ncbi:MAG: type II toxin-antitoxin system RelE/ParE family toxin [Legionellales bacterium]|jgi:mRNA interferase RelE/StbE